MDVDRVNLPLMYAPVVLWDLSGLLLSHVITASGSLVRHDAQLAHPPARRPSK
jgi:hypothetical protein